MRRTAFVATIALCLTAACTSPQEAKDKQAKKNPPADKDKVKDKDKEPQKDKEPEPPKEKLATAAISSVQMIEDCPDEASSWRPPPPPSKPAAASPPAEPAAAAKPMQAPAAAEPVPMDMDIAPGAASRIADGGDFRQPCTQSTMQIAFTGQGNIESKVSIKSVRVIDPASGKEVGRVEAREPAAWKDRAYQSWNETINPREEVKSSYMLSVPKWSEVEKAIGGKSSFGYMFILEVEVKVGDEVQTVRSAQFPREEPHVIVT